VFYITLPVQKPFAELADYENMPNVSVLADRYRPLF